VEKLEETLEAAVVEGIRLELNGPMLELLYV
jgi:hypothetical protein